MRILAVIANFGTRNDQYVQRLLEEYRGVPGADVVVLTNVRKSFGDGVEVVVRDPIGDPWTFPFAHKQILADRCDAYDLFIYSEDDTLITGKNIDAFLRSTAVLPNNEIAGFLRTEQDIDGQLYISTVHSHFHWDPASVVSRGSELFARFTNEHAAAYMLTRAQLKHAIQSGGFLVEPHREKYDYLVTAATDPYTQCGLKKVISISHIDGFLLPHLANKYVGKMGVSEALFRRQLSALRAIRRGTLPAITLLPGRGEGDSEGHRKSYYEPSSSELLSLIPSKTRTLLSYGCGWGAIETAIAARGIQVTAVPLDSVIGTCAEGKGVEVVYEDADSLMMSLSGRQFDAILISNMLHLVTEPTHLLARLRRLLSQNGTLIATLPNLRRASTMWRQLRRQRAPLSGRSRSVSAYRPSYGEARRWFRRAGFKITTSVPCIPERAQALCRMTGQLTAPLLASEFLIAASRLPAHGSEMIDDVTAFTRA